MNSYTLADLNTIWTTQSYLSFDRFVHYFTLRFGYTEKEAIAAFKVFSEFPKHVYGDEEMQKRIDKIIPLAIQIVDEIQSSWANSTAKNISYDDKELRKLIYSKDNEVKEVVLDLHRSTDIVTYAELIKQGVTQIALLRYCDEVEKKHTDKKLQIFEGDIFDTKDLFYGVKSNVYVAERTGNFKKLLYIKGKGYLRKGELNYDEGDYNSHVLLLREWVKIGNVTTDLVKLTDDGVGA